MAKFIENAASAGRVHLQDDLLTNLTKLKIIQNGKPTLAAMLLFGNHGYSIHIGRFKAADTIIDDLLIKDPLLKALDEAEIFIKKHINLSYAFDGSLQRKERWQYPLESIRELLLNAVVHRDYKNSSDIVIKIFDDRILFTNPGRIYGNLTIEDLKRDDYVSSIRNKLLAEHKNHLREIRSADMNKMQLSSTQTKALREIKAQVISDFPVLDQESWETGIISVLPLRNEIMRNGIRL